MAASIFPYCTLDLRHCTVPQEVAIEEEFLASHSSLDIRERFSRRSRLEQIKLVIRYFLAKRALPAFPLVHTSRQRALQLFILELFHPPHQLSAFKKAPHSFSRSPETTLSSTFVVFGGNDSVAHPSAFDQLRSHLRARLSSRTDCIHEIGHGCRRNKISSG
jgi:hypothetical protein